MFYSFIRVVVRIILFLVNGNAITRIPTGYLKAITSLWAPTEPGLTPSTTQWRPVPKNLVLWLKSNSLKIPF